MMGVDVDSHQLHMMLIRQAAEEADRERSRAEVGDLALFHGRLVEVVEVFKTGDHNRASAVEFVDAGGVKRTFELDKNPWSPNYDFRILSRPHDRVLDAIVDATRLLVNPRIQLQLRTERWMADPWPGDLFHMDFTYWIMIHHVSPELISARETESFSVETGWEWRPVEFSSVEELRNRYRLVDEPGYVVMGHSSRRQEAFELIPRV